MIRRRARPLPAAADATRTQHHRCEHARNFRDREDPDLETPRYMYLTFSPSAFDFIHSSSPHLLNSTHSHYYCTMAEQTGAKPSGGAAGAAQPAPEAPGLIQCCCACACCLLCTRKSESLEFKHSKHIFCLGDDLLIIPRGIFFLWKVEFMSIIELVLTTSISPFPSIFFRHIL